MSFHLTHVGPYAGLPLCGGPKTAQDQHPSYSAAGLARQLANCCEACRAEWEAAAEDCCPSCGGAECGGRGCRSDLPTIGNAFYRIHPEDDPSHQQVVRLCAYHLKTAESCLMVDQRDVPAAE